MKRTLRIAVVTETFPPEVNGVALTIDLMARGLLERGHAVEVIRPEQPRDRGAPERRPLVEVLVPGLPIPGYSSLRMGLPAPRVLKRRWQMVRPDVVQVVTEGPLGLSAVLAARKLGIPVASEYRTDFGAYAGHYGTAWLKAFVGRYLRLLHNATAVTMVPTHELASRLERSGYRGVKVVSRGVDTDLFDRRRRSLELREQWRADPRAPVYLHVGRLAREKNLDLLFGAFDSAREIEPGARLVIVGDGPDRARLEKQYPGHVFAGVKRGADLAAHYASADVFLYPSLTETFGNVTLEAMASGLAVVAFDYAAAGDHIRHEVNGLLARYGDRGQFQALARETAVSMAQTLRLGQAARVAAASVTWERVIDALEDTLCAMVRPGRESAAEPAYLFQGLPHRD